MLTTFDLHNYFWPLVFVFSQKHALYPHLCGTEGKCSSLELFIKRRDSARHLIKWVVIYTCQLKVKVILNLMNWFLLTVIPDEVIVIGLASWWFSPCLLYTQQELFYLEQHGFSDFKCPTKSLLQTRVFVSEVWVSWNWNVGWFMRFASIIKQS